MTHTHLPSLRPSPAHYWIARHCRLEESAHNFECWGGGGIYAEILYVNTLITVHCNGELILT